MKRVDDQQPATPQDDSVAYENLSLILKVLQFLDEGSGPNTAVALAMKAAIRIQDADYMAAVIDDMIYAGHLDSRSRLSDARLDYGKPFTDEAQRKALLARSESAPIRHFKVRVDVWYQPHKDLGKKQKPPERVPVYVIVEAGDLEAAIKAATEWADSTGPGSKGRKMLSIEHRSTGPIKFPMVVES